MAWSASAAFRTAFVTFVSIPAEALDLDTDAFKVALYDNDITPSKDVSQANSCYNVDQWTSAGNEVTDASGWPAGGRSLVTPAITEPSTGVVMWDAVDTTSANSNTTLANVFGCLVYDDTSTTPSDQGISYHYFGGTQSVTAGTFTIQWHANGLMRITV